MRSIATAQFTRGYIWLILLPVLLISGFVQAQKPATPVAQADRRCGQCHQAILSSYLKTPMANASGLAEDRLIPGTYHHAASNVDYSVLSTKEGSFLSYSAPRVQGEALAGTEKLQYFLGSSHLGTTYLYSRNDYLFESPIAFYSMLNGYAMKPGLEKSTYMPGGLALNDACLRCHMSGVRKPDAGTDNHYAGLPFLHTGVTCEACHGDADRHASGQGKAAMVNLMTISAIKRDSVCIVCHLEGDTNVERKSRSIVDYQPGDDIRDYLNYFTYRKNVSTQRAVSEVEQFSVSRCKIASGDKMSCMNCHDPHASPPEAERVAYYRGKCLTCHAGEPFASQHHPENRDCTSCHMPKTGSENIAHVAWTDHRIRKLPDERKDEADIQKLELASVLNTPNNRDLGLAYYNLVVRGDRTRVDTAQALLAQARKNDPTDLAVLRALGVLAEMQGDDATAGQEYRAVLALDPANLTAATNLGTLLAKSGHISEAAALWVPAFNRNEDLAPLGRNLAIAQCVAGDRDKAVETLHRALTYNPDVPALKNALASIESGERKCRPQ